MAGRPSKCGKCGECPRCVRAARAREKYAALSVDERRAVVAARDVEAARATDRARYDRDKEKRLALARQYALDHPEKIAEHKKAWVERNPEKHRAHVMVSNALRDGRLVKGPCEYEGQGGCSGRIEAHHDDYAKPLEVRWLCSAHHAELRRKER